VTNEVLRKLCPLEAELLKDPTIKAKVRFRLVIKIYTGYASIKHGLLWPDL